MPPVCWQAGCTRDLVGQWQRRPTEAELDEQTAADPASTVAVHACDVHAITTVLAQHVHQASCVSPDPKTLPGCSCSPEPLPAPDPLPEVITLPTGWTIPEAPPAP